MCTSASASALALTDCRLEGRTGAVNARCGGFDVAENRADAASARIRIHVAVVPALRKQALPDPVFVISGGPGQAASDFYLSSIGAFEALRRDRDIVIVDQRGTGKSNRLDCVMPDELETPTFDANLIKRSTRDCLSKLPGDPRFYSTSVAVRDLNDIRAALGYAQLNVYGISYGTRVAQHYLRRYPQHVRAVVLDGVVPAQAILGPDVAPAAQAALDAILARCAADAACAKAFPNLAEELQRVRRDLSARAQFISLPDPRSAEPRELEFGPMHLSVALRLHSYSDATASLLPFLIHETAQGRPQVMAAQALLVSRDLSEQMANGMHNAVVCTEDAPFFTPEALADRRIDASYLGRVFVDTLQTMCAEWPRGELDADFHSPLTSDKPVLLLSGQHDPVTPVSYGDIAVKGFANGKHVVVPGQGHGQLNSACASRVMRRFIEDGSAATLDLACIAKQIPTPFMLNASGPSP